MLRSRQVNFTKSRGFSWLENDFDSLLLLERTFLQFLFIKLRPPPPSSHQSPFSGQWAAILGGRVVWAGYEIVILANSNGFYQTWPTLLEEEKHCRSWFNRLFQSGKKGIPHKKSLQIFRGIKPSFITVEGTSQESKTHAHGSRVVGFRNQSDFGGNDGRVQRVVGHCVSVFVPRKNLKRRDLKSWKSRSVPSKSFPSCCCSNRRNLQSSHNWISQKTFSCA